MKKRMKIVHRLPALVLFALLLLGLSCVHPTETRAAAKDFTTKDSCISGYTGSKNVKSLTIPYTINGKKMKGFDYSLRDALKGLKHLETITISEGYTSLADEYGFSVFWGLDIKKINLPSTLKKIDEESFLWCEKLTSITIPASVTAIGSDAFSGCLSLKKVTLPSHLQSIGKNAFEGCSKLSSISQIPASCKSIGANAFSGTALKTVKVSGSNAKYKAVSGVLYDKKVTKIIFFPSASTMKTYKVPATVKSIGKHLMYSNIQKLVIPGGVKKIGTEACGGCFKLKEVEIQPGTTSIGARAFWACPKLKKVRIPSSVKTIAKSAFTTSAAGDGLYPIRIATFYVPKNSYAAKTLKSQYFHVKLSYVKDKKVLKTPTITAKSLTKPSNAKAFSLGAKVTGGVKLKYSSSKTSIATINSSGKITLKGKAGKTTITITSTANATYKSVSKKITLSVFAVPSAPKLGSCTKAFDIVTLKWSKASNASGYMIYRSDGKSEKKIADLGKDKSSYTIYDNPSKKYTFWIKAYRTYNSKKYAGGQSKKYTADFMKVARKSIAASVSDPAGEIPMFNIYNAFPAMERNQQVPQGICAAEDYILVSAYAEGQAASIVVLDRKTLETRALLKLKLNADFVDFEAHVGGIAYDRDSRSVWVSGRNQSEVLQIAIDRIDEIVSGLSGTLEHDMLATDYKSYEIDKNPSFLTYYNGLLYVGGFSKSALNSLKAYKFENGKLNPVSGQNITIPNKIQGAVFDEQGYLYLSQSYGRKNPSKIYVCTKSGSTCTLKKVISVDAGMSEEMEVIDGKLYVLFESSSGKYQGAETYKVQNKIWAVDLSAIR